jgi:hypothetical protein
VQRFSRLPPDVWVATAAALGILLVAPNRFQPVFVGIFVMACAYVVAKTFTGD